MSTDISIKENVDSEEEARTAAAAEIKARISHSIELLLATAKLTGIVSFHLQMPVYGVTLDKVRVTELSDHFYRLTLRPEVASVRTYESRNVNVSRINVEVFFLH